jgi:3-mercaptopyruvate sulfurtransferase SseA
MVDQEFMKVARFSLLSTALVLVMMACAPLQSASAPQVVDEPGEVARRLSLEEARAAYDKNEALFLDVRSAGSYASSHIPGARSIPLGELESRMGELNPDQWIITYCT